MRESIGKTIVDRMSPGMVEREPEIIAKWIDEAVRRDQRDLLAALEAALRLPYENISEQEKIYGNIRAALAKAKGE